jgi:hypothetical protein
MTVIEHSGPRCRACGVVYIAEYEGPCQEPRCYGSVSWEATADALAEQLRGAVEALETIAAASKNVYPGEFPEPMSRHEMVRVAQRALGALGGQ